MKARMKGGTRKAITSLQVMAKSDDLYRTLQSRDGNHGVAQLPEKRKAACHSIGLDDQVMEIEMYQTPTSRDYKDTGDSIQNGNVPVNGLLGRAVGHTKMSGSLDPEFVEYLMGFPIGFTACDASGMQLSRKSQRSSAEPSSKSNP